MYQQALHMYSFGMILVFNLKIIFEYLFCDSILNGTFLFL